MIQEYFRICLKQLFCCGGNPRFFLPPPIRAFPEKKKGMTTFQTSQFSSKTLVLGSLIWRDISYKWFVWTIRTIQVSGNKFFCYLSMSMCLRNTNFFRFI